MVGDECLHLSRQMLLKLFHIPRTVQKEGSSVHQFLNHVVFIHIRRIMACHEVRFVNQICGLDRFLAETQVRHGHTAGLLGIIIKVCLCIHIGVVADDLDGVLIGADRTVCTQTPEFTVGRSFRSRDQRSTGLKRQVCHVIHDTDGEFLLRCIVIDCNDLCRRGVFGTKAITSGKDRRIVELRSLQRCNHIQVKRLAKCARLFGSVKNRNLFYRIRNRFDQCFCAERTVQTYLYHTNLPACCQQIVDGLLDGIAYGTHGNDHMFCIRSTIIVEQFITGSDLCIDLVHVLLNDRRKRIIIRITCLASLEEDIRVLSGTSLARMIRIQRIFSVCIDGIHVNHILQILVIPLLDLLDLMGGTESIEEIDERKTSLDRCTMSHRRQVHNLLYAGLAEHGCTGLTACIYIRVITEDRQRMACQRTCRYIEYTRKSLTCYFIQVGDHQ